MFNVVTETTTLFDTTAATTNEVSTMIETTVIQVSLTTTANDDLQDQQGIRFPLFQRPYGDLLVLALTSMSLWLGQLKAGEQLLLLFIFQR